MTGSTEFVEYLAEQVRPLGLLRSKRMFGGIGIYIDDLFCAIIVDETLYIKADQVTVGQFQQSGCRPFAYMADGVAHNMQYYQIPDQALDSGEEMNDWMRLGMEAALRKASGAKAPKTTKRKK